MSTLYTSGHFWSMLSKSQYEIKCFSKNYFLMKFYIYNTDNIRVEIPFYVFEWTDKMLLAGNRRHEVLSNVFYHANRFGTYFYLFKYATT